MPHKTSLQEMTNCCGIYIIHSFYKNLEPFKTWKDAYNTGYTFHGLSDQTDMSKWNKSQGAETFDEYKSRIRAELKGWTEGYRGRKSYFLATLNEKENNDIGDIILDAGFEVLVPMTRNPTGTKIITYIYHLLPKEKQAVNSVLKKAVNV